MGGIVYLALRRYLSWIEGLTTNQNVTGSNPVRRTSRLEDPDCSGGPGFSFQPLRGLGVRMPDSAARAAKSHRLDSLQKNANCGL